MKKLIVAFLFMSAFGLTIPSFASDPTAIPIGTQLQLGLLSHVTAVEENTTHGQVKTEFLDGIIQFGHYKSDYICAIDAGFSNSLNPDANGNIAGTVGFHIHALQALVDVLPTGSVSPALLSAVQLLELNPRYSYDEDVRHGVLGVTFGAQIPFN